MPMSRSGLGVVDLVVADCNKDDEQLHCRRHWPKLPPRADDLALFIWDLGDLGLLLNAWIPQ